MKIISLVQFVLKFVGALPSLAQHRLYRIYGYFILFIMIANLYSYVLALIVNIENASKFCQTLSMSMGALAGIAKAATFISFKDVFERLINDIQSIVATSVINGRCKHYEKFSKIEERYSRLYAIFMTLCSQFLSIGPILNIVFTTLFLHRAIEFRYPCEEMYLIRDESVIEYIFLYLFCALNIHLAGAFLFVSDAGFFGINMYLVAGFQDLADNFAEIRPIKSTKPINCDELIERKKIVECVDFHNKLLNLADSLQELYSPIIFFQFLMSCLQICAITLEILLHENISTDRIIQVMPIYPTCLAILFIYCKFGNELFVKARELSTEIYNTTWYDYTRHTQTLIPLIMQRAQKPVQISGFKFFTCTLENYTKVLNKVASMLTLLRQLLNT